MGKNLLENGHLKDREGDGRIKLRSYLRFSRRGGENVDCCLLGCDFVWEQLLRQTSW
jgi:hypothetical protein